MKPVRLTWIDYAKGIAILLVIYRHVFEGIKLSGASIDGREFLEYANIFLFSFRMPLFFIISGVFISKSLGKKGQFIGLILASQPAYKHGATLARLAPSPHWFCFP